MSSISGDLPMVCGLSYPFLQSRIVPKVYKFCAVHCIIFVLKLHQNVLELYLHFSSNYHLMVLNLCSLELNILLESNAITKISNNCEFIIKSETN